MQGQENEPLHLPSSMGLGDALNALFKSGERIADTSDIPSQLGENQQEQRTGDDRDGKRLQDHFIENFLLRYIPVESIFSMRQEVQIVHDQFPIWKAALMRRVTNMRSGDSTETVKVLEGITLMSCANFAAGKYDSLTRNCGKLLPGSDLHLKISKEANNWQRISEISKFASEFKE